MAKTVFQMVRCGNCRWCIAGGRIHGPYPSHYVSSGGHQTHYYGFGGGGGGVSGGGSAVADPDRMRGDAEEDAAVRFMTLDGEHHSQITAVLAAKKEARKLRRRAQSAVRKRIEQRFEDTGELPTVDETSEIERAEYGRIEPQVEKVRRRASRAKAKLSKMYERDEEDRERYERQALREMTVECERTFFSVVSGEGGIRRSKDTHEEWREIPLAYRAGQNRGMTADDMAQHLSMSYPEFGIHDERDLMDFFTSGKYKTR